MGRIGRYLAFLFFLAVVNVQFSSVMYQQGAAWQLDKLSPEDSDFRRLALSEKELTELISEARRSGMEPGEALAILTSDAAKSARGPEDGEEDFFVKWKLRMIRYAPRGFARVSGYYAAILDDVECFPVVAGGISYENSWMFERNYGGKRGHEGTDLMPPENLRGQYRVVSMTDGVVEKIGWLPLGGYRIGIRSPSGGYFYYAHLDSYSRAFCVGDEILAGTVLGRMGDSGYGPEGTRGKFDVHLHLGIYIRAGSAHELSINPYWVLRYAQML